LFLRFVLYFRKVFNLRGNKYASSSDEEILKVYRHTQDVAAWAALYERYMHLVYGVCMNILRDKKKSEDASMYLFESLPELILRYKIEHFKSWLFTVTRNHCYLIEKKTIRERHTAYQFLSEANGEETEESNAVHAMDHLPSCLEILKNEQYQCVELFYLQQKSYQEIVEITGFSLNKVKSYIQNGKRNLRNCLESKR